LSSPEYIRSVKAAMLKRPSGRRSQKRWAFRRELRFSYRSGDAIFLGSGRTQDLSEDGVRFENDHQVPVNSEIELRISWPILLQDVCPLELVVRGRLIRSDRDGSVLHVSFREFHTCGERSFEQPVDSLSCSVFA
jgi:hypothetical protein